MKEQIEYVLKFWSYSRALEIYCSHAPDSILKTILKKGESVFNTGKLKEELIKLSNAAPKKAPESKPAKLPAVKELPPELKARETERIALYAEMSRLHAQLKLFKTDEERKAPAARIKVCASKIADAWDALDIYLQTGELQKVANYENLKYANEVLMARRFLNLRTYISRAKTGKRPATPEKIALWENELTHLENELDA